MGGSGVPVCARSVPRAGGGAAVALRGAAVRVQLGPGPGQGEPRPAGGRAQLRGTGELLTPAISWSAWRLRKDFNAVKRHVAPWWPENSKEAYASGLANLAAALANWAASRAGTRKGPKIAFPKFKGKRSVLSVRFTTGAFGLPDHDRRHVRLPRIGLVRTHESTRKLARRVDTGIAQIRSVTVSYRRGRWHASFCVEADRADRVPARPAGTVGVDVGISHLAVLSSGQVIPNPRPLDKAQRDLRRLARQASRRARPDRRTGRQPSQRWRKTQAKLARRHARAANLRDNALHQLTTRLAAAYGTVVVEDLHVAGMLKNRRLARHLADAGFGRIRRQLGYKTAWRGGQLVVADRFYPSSKTCSGCGAVKAKLRLSSGPTGASGATWSWTGISTPPATWPPWPAARPPRVAGRR